MFGFVRETEEKAIQAGVDPLTGLCRTGLDTYLSMNYQRAEATLVSCFIETNLLSPHKQHGSAMVFPP